MKNVKLVVIITVMAIGIGMGNSILGFMPSLDKDTLYVVPSKEELQKRAAEKKHEEEKQKKKAAKLAQEIRQEATRFKEAAKSTGGSAASLAIESGKSKLSPKLHRLKHALGLDNIGGKKEKGPLGQFGDIAGSLFSF